MMRPEVDDVAVRLSLPAEDPANGFADGESLLRYST